MSLARYKKMRHFGDTPEPSGGASTAGAPIFVVQLHHASHRHYDFRLEHDGVLKSWAVPKGPSFDPHVKRLAMQVEDHPLDYATFEGRIPEGNYGAGDVRVFDHGTWSSDADVEQQLKKGHLHFALDGDKLKGQWDLIRTGGHGERPQWLLKRVDDAEAGPFESDDLLGDPDDYQLPDEEWHSHRPGTSRRGVGRAPKGAPKGDKKAEPDALAGAKKETIDASFFAPELARATLAPPSGDDWIHEPKWDGYRLLAAVADGKARLWSRNGIEWTQKVPHVIEAIEKLGARALRLDGELVALGKDGKISSTDFNALQAALSGDGKADLKYVVFDLLHADGLDLSAMPLSDRKKMLHGVVGRLGAKDAIVEGEYTVGGDAKALYARHVKAGYEGIVSKRAGSPYRAGRGDDWKKLRGREAEELAVVGYTDPRGSRHGIGALLMGRPREDGGWDYAGRVGTGLGHELLAQLGEQLPAMERKTPPVHEHSLELPRENGDLRSVHWVTPKLTVEVEHHGRGNGGLLRQPSVKALRLDKTPADLTKEPAGDRAIEEEEPSKPAKRASRAKKLPAPEPVVGTVRVTHPERVVYPDVGVTKGDVFAYYEAVAPLMLREIGNRPLAIVRCPNGAAGHGFFQKHVKPGLGKHVLGAPAEGNNDETIYVKQAEGLLELVQMNALEIHAWGTHVDHVDHCDTIVMDLDPADDVPWKRVVQTAQLIHASMESVGLESFVRLSGGKGVHIVVPLDPPAPWDEAKGFAQKLAHAMSVQDPDGIIDVMTKARRTGKIFVDYLRNGRGATSVASYSLRKHPEATVAMPIEWAELPRVKGPKAYDLRNAPAHLARRKRDPWEGIADVKQRLPRVK